MVDFEYVEKLLSIPDLILNSEDKRNIMEYVKHLQDELNIQTALAQNGASALETSNALANKLQILTLNFNKLQEDFLKIINSETDLLPCDFCEHYIPCLADKCDSYEHGVGMTDESGKYYDWTWTCLDFNFGTCRKLENTSCNNCNFKDNFKWKEATLDEQKS